MKKSESESECERKAYKLNVAESQEALGDRILALEKILVHVQHTNTDDGTRHQNDGGWFD